MKIIRKREFRILVLVVVSVGVIVFGSCSQVATEELESESVHYSISYVYLSGEENAVTVRWKIPKSPSSWKVQCNQRVFANGRYKVFEWPKTPKFDTAKPQFRHVLRKSHGTKIEFEIVGKFANDGRLDQEGRLEYEEKVFSNLTVEYPSMDFFEQRIQAFKSKFSWEHSKFVNDQTHFKLKWGDPDVPQELGWEIYSGDGWPGLEHQHVSLSKGTREYEGDLNVAGKDYDPYIVLVLVGEKSQKNPGISLKWRLGIGWRNLGRE